jgi:hypothetical protein
VRLADSGGPNVKEFIPSVACRNTGQKLSPSAAIERIHPVERNRWLLTEEALGILPSLWRVAKSCGIAEDSTSGQKVFFS